MQVKIQDQYRPTEAFDAATMGTWKVRLIRQMAYNKTEALTDFANAPNGEASFAVDLSKVDTTSVRIVAEAGWCRRLRGIPGRCSPRGPRS